MLFKDVYGRDPEKVLGLLVAEDKPIPDGKPLTDKEWKALTKQVEDGERAVLDYKSKHISMKVQMWDRVRDYIQHGFPGHAVFDTTQVIRMMANDLRGHVRKIEDRDFMYHTHNTNPRVLYVHLPWRLDNRLESLAKEYHGKILTPYRMGQIFLDTELDGKRPMIMMAAVARQKAGLPAFTLRAKVPHVGTPGHAPGRDPKGVSPASAMAGDPALLAAHFGDADTLRFLVDSLGRKLLRQEVLTLYSVLSMDVRDYLVHMLPLEPKDRSYEDLRVSHRAFIKYGFDGYEQGYYPRLWARYVGGVLKSSAQEHLALKRRFRGELPWAVALATDNPPRSIESTMDLGTLMGTQSAFTSVLLFEMSKDITKSLEYAMAMRSLGNEKAAKVFDACVQYADKIHGGLTLEEFANVLNIKPMGRLSWQQK